MNTTVENNKLIAEFMEDVNKLLHNNIFISPYQYHSDWNVLLEVVEKIESFEDENRQAKYNFQIEQSFVSIIDNNTSDFIFDGDADTKKEAVYNAVVEFIKFYNSAQKEN